MRHDEIDVTLDNEIIGLAENIIELAQLSCIWTEVLQIIQ